jgi:branched-chain amino acid transport system substrate-binding protein
MMMRSLKANDLQSKGPLKPVSFQAAGPTRLRIAELAGEKEAGHMSKKRMSQVDGWFAQLLRASVTGFAVLGRALAAAGASASKGAIIRDGFTDDDLPVLQRMKVEMLVAKYGIKAPWHSLTTVGMSQALVMVRAVETAARKYGGDKLTGELLYKTLIDTNFASKDFFGYSGGDIDYSVEAPFPTRDPRVNIGQVVGGKLTTAATQVPVPNLAKW